MNAHWIEVNKRQQATETNIDLAADLAAILGGSKVAQGGPQFRLT